MLEGLADGTYIDVLCRCRSVHRKRIVCFHGLVSPRVRVVSNFGDSGEIHARAREWSPARRRATRRGA